MRKATTAVTLVLSLLLLSTRCDRSVEPPGGANSTQYGTPHKITIFPIPVPETQRVVEFGVIADSHIDASYAGWVPFHDWEYCFTPHTNRNRTTIDDINIDAWKAGCLGIVHLGDMTDADNNQNLVAFRQLYEDDYPGIWGGAIAGASDDDYDAYSCGHRINKPVFPTLGNHDCHDGPPAYIAERVGNATGLVASYGRTSYIWRWGQYYFINLGLWAGSYEHESNSDIDYDKLHWLSDWLANNAGDGKLGVLIFQHYGWDGFSMNGDWWSDFMRNLELDVLMRRPLGSGNTVPGNPYNVLGIFTGHLHDHAEISVFAGLDTSGKSVHFDNFVFRDCGEESDHYGFSIVYLTGDWLKINTKNVGGNEWYWYQKPMHVGP